MNEAGTEYESRLSFRDRSHGRVRISAVLKNCSILRNVRQSYPTKNDLHKLGFFRNMFRRHPQALLL
jgi:hypothetical protein